MPRKENFPVTGLVIVLSSIIMGVGVTPRPLWESTFWEKLSYIEIHEKYIDAITYVDQLLELEPWRSELWLKRGELAFLSGQDQLAIDSFNFANSFFPLSSQGKVLLAESYERNGDQKSAEGLWLELSQDDDLNKEGYLKTYRALLQIKETELAYRTILNWSKGDPENLEVPYYLGITKVIIDPASAKSDLVLAERVENRKSQEIRNLITTLEMEGIDPAYHWALIGQALGNLSEWELARIAIEKAIELSPNYANAWSLLGEAKEHLGLDGYPDLLTAQQIDPDSSFLKATFSIYWRRNGHPEVALLYLQDLVKEEPGDPTWQIELANTAVEMQNIPQALEYLQAAIILDPEKLETWQRIAEFCLTYDIDLKGLGNQATNKAMLLAPENSVSNDLMGWLLMKSEDFDNALKFLQASVSQDLFNARARMHLGQCLMNLGKEAEAKNELQKALELSTDESITEMSKRLLEKLGD